MINLHTKLLELIPDIGVDAFAVLMCIAKRVDRKMQSFPSRFTLSTETGMSKNRVSKATEILVEKGLISKEQRFLDGRLTTNLYKITNKFIGVYVTAEDIEVEEETSEETDNEPQEMAVENDEPQGDAKNTVTQKLTTEIQTTDFEPAISINQVGSINQMGRGEPPKKILEKTSTENPKNLFDQKFDELISLIGIPMHDLSAFEIQKIIKKHPENSQIDFLDYLINARSKQKNWEKQKLDIGCYRTFFWTDFLSYRLEKQVENSRQKRDDELEVQIVDSSEFESEDELKKYQEERLKQGVRVVWFARDVAPPPPIFKPKKTTGLNNFFEQLPEHLQSKYQNILQKTI